MDLYPYADTWESTDHHANFKAEVALYTVTDPLPTLEVLSQSTGIPVPCLIRYVLVKHAASGADALLAMGPIVLRQMEEHIENAEAAGTDAARRGRLEVNQRTPRRARKPARRGQAQGTGSVTVIGWQPRGSRRGRGWQFPDILSVAADASCRP